MGKPEEARDPRVARARALRVRAREVIAASRNERHVAVVRRILQRKIAAQAINGEGPREAPMTSASIIAEIALTRRRRRDPIGAALAIYGAGSRLALRALRRLRK
jgi:hypothetical protein